MPTTVTSSNEINTPDCTDGYSVGKSSSSLVGFWGKAPVDQPSALTAALTTITLADTAGTPDYAIAAMTTSTPAGWPSVQEAITTMFVIQNLQTRVAELESRLEECGIIAAN